MPAVHLVTGAFVAPLAPAAGLGAGALITILAWLICFTLAYIWRRSFGPMLQWIADELDRVRLPSFAGGGHVFGAVANAFRTADSAVEGALVYAANATEHGAVWLFHETAARFDQVGREIGGLAYDVSRWGTHLVHSKIPRMIAQALFMPLVAIALTRQIIHALRTHTNVRVSALRADVHSIGHSTSVVLPRSIGRVRTREGRLEHDLEAVKARVGRLAALATLAGFSAFMWRWMGRHGLRWLRCPSFARIGSRIGCGGFALLEELLAASFAALVLTDICTFAGALTRLAEWYKPLLMELVDAEDALIGCHGATKPAPLGLPRLYLPPVPDPLPLG